MFTGQLVLDRRNKQAGIAKISLLTAGQAEITYFHSAAQQESKIVPLTALDSYELQPQNRAYVLKNDRWSVGRIKMCRTSRDEPYWVAFPNGVNEDVLEQDLYVRASGPVEPLDILKLYAHETAFYFDRRWPVIEHLTAQRAACGGMAGFLSSNIDLQPHQLDTAQTVLRDPVRRYLLADEVGLGKTIEAGIILRQTLLENPQTRAVILVPDHLQAQWRDELQRRFFICPVPVDSKLENDFPDSQVLLQSHGAPAETPADLIIIDEAHHLTTLAFGTPAERAQYARLAHWVHEVRDVLLLSATPASSNQQAYLGMLHLLEPHSYRMKDLQHFEKRVAAHEQLSQALFALRPTSVPLMMHYVLEQLRTLFPNDVYLRGLIETLLKFPEEPQPELVNSIRAHLGDSYRLHRRLIRHRRDVHASDLVRGRQFAQTVDLDLPSLQRAWEEWDVWRESLAVSAESDPAVNVKTSFVPLFEAAQQGIPEWTEATRRRMAQASSTQEREVLERMLRELQAVSLDEMDVARATAIRRWLNSHPQKTVLFLSSGSAGERLATHLARSLGQGRVFNVSRDETAVGRFRKTPEMSVLIVDQANEEGLNLQCAAQVMYLDLPTHPQRLEQRVGRLDRYAQGLGIQPMTSTVLVTTQWNPVLMQHLRSLQEDWKVFDRSITKHQHVMDDCVGDWQIAALQGQEQMERYRAALPERLSTEEKRVQGLELLESLHQSNAARLKAQIDQIYDTESQGFDRSFNDWVQKTLTFRDMGTPPEVRYCFDKNRTMVPWEWIGSVFGRVNNRPSSFKRRQAQQKDLHVLRLGDPFVSAMEQYMRWDDRGRVFAYWRHEPHWTSLDSVYFRLFFVIEADSQLAVKATSREHNADSARQILDDLSPPMTFTVTLDSFGHPITPEVEALLTPRYKSGTSRDYNLSGDRLRELHTLLPGDLWAQTCDHIYSMARTRLAENVAYQHSINEAHGRARAQFEQEIGALQSRLAAKQPDVTPKFIKQHRQYQQALLAGIQQPHVTLDAIGAVVLSGRDPFLHEAQRLA